MKKGKSQRFVDMCGTVPERRSFFIRWAMIGLICIGMLSLSGVSPASQPRIWIDASLQDLSGGETSGVMITASGEIHLALPFERVADLNEAVIWDAWKEGNKLYVATGHEGRVYEIDISTLKSRVIADLDETEAQAVTVWKGNLYIAANPGAVLYRWNRSREELEVVWRSEESYIWDLLAWKGALYIATGDQGRLYRIGEDGRPTVILDASDLNLVRLYHNDQFLYVGAASPGTVYQINEQGSVSMVIPAGRVEIGGLTGSLEGTGWDLIVASIGQTIEPLQPRRRPPGYPLPPSTPGAVPGGSEEIVVTAKEIDVTGTQEGEAVQEGQRSQPEPKQPAVTTFPLSLSTGPQAGEIWAVDRNLRVIRLWEVQALWVYEVAVFNGEVWVGAGSPGRIYSIDRNRQITLQGTFDEENIVRLIPERDALWVFTGNPARVYRARIADRQKGVYVSEVKDAGFVSYWGMLQWKGMVPGGASVQCFARSGNTRQPDGTWSRWFGPIRDRAELKLPPSRYFQYRCELEGSWKDSPRIQDIRISFLPQNQPPRIRSVRVLPSGVVYREVPVRQGMKIAGSDDEVLESTPPERHNATPVINLQRPTRGQRSVPLGPIPGQELYKWGMQTVVWQAEDPDEDDLTYEVYIQKQDEAQWHLLKKDLDEPIIAWDTTTLPDGWYRVRIVASDEGVNPPGQGLRDEKISNLFPVDHTPPVIQLLNVQKRDNQIAIRFKVTDQLSPIISVEYALSPDQWKPVYPVDRILDHLEESFELTITRKPDVSEVQIRALDSGRNIGVITVSVR